MNQHQWLSTVTNNDSVRAIARASGLSYSTINHQLHREQLSSDNIIKIAIAYGHHPVRALVENGFLDPYYAQSVDPVTAIRQLSDEQIADEVLRRMKEGHSETFDTDIDELEQRRRERMSDPFDTIPDDAVADSSPEEGDGMPDDYEP